MVCALTNSLEMRVSGRESHIQIGLSDLIIAAVPALKVIATMSVSFVPQCLIYLIEGMKVV